MSDLMSVPEAERRLMEAQAPEETLQLEAISKAGIAYAKEEGMYEELVKIWKFYIRAHRKTTELISIDPDLRREGRYPDPNVNDVVNISDYGFTPMQWSRRKKIFGIDENRIGDYLDDCIEKTIEPTLYGFLRYATQIIESSTGDEWWTPERYMKSVHSVMGEIDLDPATCHEANAIVKANTIYTIEDDGLQQPWSGRVFLNPPYSRNKDFAEKMVHEFEHGEVSQAVVLLGAHAIETKWFANYWEYVLCFTGHRITFNTPDGLAKAGNIAGSVFVYLGDEQNKFAKEFIQHGYVVKRWPQ